jgi:DNA (cytosine-5)-methyltransferase 1
MNIQDISRVLNPEEWNKCDYRTIKRDFFELAQKFALNFSPQKPQETVSNKIQLIDFFCGAGGTSLGFAAVNAVIPTFKMLAGCDINTASAQTYSHNYGTPLLNTDILQIANEKDALQAVLDKIGYNSKMPTILIGCAPCQGFSSHRKKNWNSEDDARNSLIIAFAQVVKYIEPDAIIMENVPEFLSKKYWKYFADAYNQFTDCGYTVKQSIYNAAAFGVPQERFRSIVIGMKKDFVLPTGYYSPENYRTVRDAIGDLPPVKAGVTCPDDYLHKSAAHKQSTIDVIRQVPHNGGNRPVGVGPACLDKVKGFSDVYGRLWWDKPSITITHYARNPASGRYSHPEQDRGLTAREAALLQGFPNGFEFCGKYDDIYRQIGEAVPPLLSCAIATNVLIELISCAPTQEELDSAPKSVTSPVSNSYSSVIAGIKNTRKKVRK